MRIPGTGQSGSRVLDVATFVATYVLAGSLVLAASQEDATDLTGKAAAVVKSASSDNFANEYRYEVSVKNLTGTPLIADSILIVLEKVTNLAGSDRDPLRKEPLLDQIDVLGSDGETSDGKPYFRMPVNGGPDLMPFGQSPPVTVRFRNPSYISGLVPSFRILGRVREPEPVHAPEPKPVSAPAAQPPSEDSLQTLIELLIRKGILTREEWLKVAPSTDQPSP